MIDFRLEEEHEALRKTVEEFARTEVAPVIGWYYDHQEFPYDLVAKMGRMGLYGLPFPEEYGGTGGDALALCIALEELARVDSSTAVALYAGVCLGAMPVHRFGTAAQKARWLPSLTSGEALAALGVTEPGGGTDTAGAIRTRAVLRDGQWTINGGKSFITNSGTGITRLITITAVTGTEPDGRKEISTIMVPSGAGGLTVAPRYSKVGWCASDTHELTFDDCRVPEENLLGPRGAGYAQCLSLLDESRLALSAIGVGLAQGCVDECLAHAGRRAAFGQLIGDYQSIQFKLADMEVRAHTARLATYQAVSRLLRGEPVKREAAIAKLVASAAATDNARDATEIFGGYGMLNDFAVGRFYRDAKLLGVAEGTGEVQRMLIARHLGLPA